MKPSITKFCSKIAIIPMLLLSCQAFADSYWNHNGSIVRLEAQGNARTFSYVKPAAKVAKLGIVDGTVLFEGYTNQGNYYGTAHAFPLACGDGSGLTYPVSGEVLNNSTKIVLTGKRLVTCGSNKTKIDTLVFTYLYSD